MGERFSMGCGGSCVLRARFDLNESDERSKLLYFKHNLIDPRFTPGGLCFKNKTICTGGTDGSMQNE
ncbi:hypothetical protein ECB98_03610 [Brucellaceae bacterium VT-16-1752]|uniref:hypothetical protein n=1 Tax=Brucella/Ochrobactrum group TaxID=2826938 RepID=UPI000F5DE8C2|nr:hypothetical protein [Brucella sp. NM4]RRD28130.1 hypothetical protein ECB98_03610 [Brucellaceae bacterium VT-16-1752]WHS32497.1 hypothetical protein QLQ09_11350 [Brucella sp. NM4]WHT41016.1 hypothetical protein QLQ11_06060 [Ochrobactrum sp. SSR]